MNDDSNYRPEAIIGLGLIAFSGFVMGLGIGFVLGVLWG